MFRKSATLWVALFLAASLTAQNTQPTAPDAAPPSVAAPLTLTLQDALQRARAINPEYRAAVTELGVAREDRVQARAALLPNVSLTGQFVYTEGHGLPGVGRFIANNGIHEYITQSDVKQVVSLGNAAEYRRANAAAALAQARAEIARRGLEVTVTQAFYGLAAMEHKFANAQRSVEEARKFYDNTVRLEQGGEV
ncbi:MAG: TolC family protein, partial [Acidobacteriales bacterium]|nr:TolC family protein [Terriglobales bacterium]